MNFYYAIIESMDTVFITYGNDGVVPVFSGFIEKCSMLKNMNDDAADNGTVQSEYPVLSPDANECSIQRVIACSEINVIVKESDDVIKKYGNNLRSFEINIPGVGVTKVVEVPYEKFNKDILDKPEELIPAANISEYLLNDTAKKFLCNEIAEIIKPNLHTEEGREKIRKLFGYEKDFTTEEDQKDVERCLNLANKL